MSNLTEALRSEIRRLARREITAELKTLKKQSTQQRRTIAELKRTVSTLRKQTGFLEKQERRRVGRPSVEAEVSDVRFSPTWLKSHRAKIGFSQADYAALIGVSPLTVYNWEQERTRPREKQLAALAAVRKLGKREARRRIELLRAG